MGSGEGSTAEVCARSAADGSLRADIGLVISNQPASGIIRRAESWEHVYGLAVDSIVINQHTHPDGAHARGQTDSESLAIAESLVKHDIDLVLMMGYLRIVGKLLLERYGFVAGRHSDVRQSRMLNWHPGPLPLTSSEYGVGAAEKVLDAYMAGKIVKSACVVHVVSESVDEGPIWRLHEVPVHEYDTPQSLFGRTQKIEKQYLTQDINEFIELQSGSQ